MLDKQFTMFQIYEHLLTKYDSKKIQVIFTDDCAKKLVLHIRFMYQNISKEITDLDQKKLKDFEQIVINDSAVKGLKNIDKAFMREIKTVDYKKNGDKYNVKEWIIETNGTNLAICLCNPSIDSTRTISNDIHEIKEIFGIEASRTILFEEIKQVIGDSGIYINDRHLNILVDVMTNKGYIMSIDRHGINRSERGPLARSSFEETTDQLVKAGVYSQVDNMVSVTANIMTGQKAKFGTHMSSIIQDMKLIIEKGKKPVDFQKMKKTIFSLKQIIS
jgi:DNA-directed RNA polymerase II subunit RPB1